MTDQEQNSMRPPYLTEQDATLTHQVRFSTRRHVVYVSCNCRATVPENSKAGKLYYEAMGPTSTLEESRRLYNDPANHNAPFGKEDEAKW